MVPICPGRASGFAGRWSNSSPRNRRDQDRSNRTGDLGRLLGDPPTFSALIFGRTGRLLPIVNGICKLSLTTPRDWVGDLRIWANCINGPTTRWPLQRTNMLAVPRVGEFDEGHMERSGYGQLELERSQPFG